MLCKEPGLTWLFSFGGIPMTGMMKRSLHLGLAFAGLLFGALNFAPNDAVASDEVRLIPGESFGFATWSVKGVVNAARLSAGYGQVSLEQFQGQVLVTYRSPTENVTGIDHVYLTWQDSAGRQFARHIGTVVLGSPKVSEFHKWTICVGKESLLPVTFGANRGGGKYGAWLLMPLQDARPQSSVHLEASLADDQSADSGFLKLRPLVEGELGVHVVDTSGHLMTLTIKGADCGRFGRPSAEP